MNKTKFQNLIPPSPINSSRLPLPKSNLINSNIWLPWNLYIKHVPIRGHKTTKMPRHTILRSFDLKSFALSILHLKKVLRQVTSYRFIAKFLRYRSFFCCISEKSKMLLRKYRWILMSTFVCYSFHRVLFESWRYRYALWYCKKIYFWGDLNIDLRVFFFNDWLRVFVPSHVCLFFINKYRFRYLVHSSLLL